MRLFQVTDFRIVTPMAVCMSALMIVHWVFDFKISVTDMTVITLMVGVFQIAGVLGDIRQALDRIEQTQRNTP